MLRRIIQLRDVLLAERAHAFGRIAQPEFAAAHGFARRNDRTGADETVVFDHRTIQHRRTHADQAGIADTAGMHDGAVADGDIVADQGREADRLAAGSVVTDMEDGAILDISSGADADVVDVAADDGARPDRAVVADVHVADDGAGRVDEHAFAEAGGDAIEGAQSRHVLTFC